MSLKSALFLSEEEMQKQKQQREQAQLKQRAYEQKLAEMRKAEKEQKLEEELSGNAYAVVKPLTSESGQKNPAATAIRVFALLVAVGGVCWAFMMASVLPVFWIAGLLLSLQSAAILWGFSEIIQILHQTQHYQVIKKEKKQ